MNVTELDITLGELHLKNADTLYGPNHVETKFWQWLCQFGSNFAEGVYMYEQAKKHDMVVPDGPNFLERFKERFMQVYAEKGEKVFE